MGATSVEQVATSGRSRATASAFGTRQSARSVTRCTITTPSGIRTYTCRARLRTGIWTLTTQAKAGSVVVAQSVSRVRVKAPQRVAVTG
jgi:nitrogen fixation protein FixH